MSEHDELLALMRRARPVPPDGLVSPRTPAAQALVEEILSMDTVYAPRSTEDERDDDRDDDRTTPTPIALGPSRRRWSLVAGVAAAALAAVATATVVSGDSDQPVEAMTLDTAVVQTTEALRGSGRAELRYDNQGPRLRETGSSRYEFSGDDYSVRFRHPEGTGPEFENRWIDGDLYIYGLDGSTGWDDLRWVRDADAAADSGSLFHVDPATLLAALGDVPFETVGDEDVDGVATRHLRATDPEEIDAAAFAIGFNIRHDTVTALDVWVDGDDLVRRIELSTFDPAEDWSSSFSIRFSDFGAPITIEPPEHFVDADLAG
jgi:hypothetical protein